MYLPVNCVLSSCRKLHAPNEAANVVGSLRVNTIVDNKDKMTSFRLFQRYVLKLMLHVSGSTLRIFGRITYVCVGLRSHRCLVLDQVFITSSANYVDEESQTMYWYNGSPTPLDSGTCTL